MIKIDLNKSVYELCSQYPDIKNLLREVGFENITNPKMLETVGKIMTIPNGCYMKRIRLDEVQQLLFQNGYIIDSEGEKQ